MHEPWSIDMENDQLDPLGLTERELSQHVANAVRGRVNVRAAAAGIRGTFHPAVSVPTIRMNGFRQMEVTIQLPEKGDRYTFICDL